MLFQIHGTQIFIIGSIHRQPQGSRLPRCYSSAVIAAESCFFEHDPGTLPSRDRIHYPVWESLQSRIPAKLFSDTIALYRQLQISELPLRCKPWWVTLQLGGTINELSGNSGRNGIDGQLWALAEQHGKPRFTLDTDIFEMFDSTPLDEQIAALNPNQLITNAARLHTAWLNGDAAVMNEIVETGRKVTPILIQKMFSDRNLRWLPSILRAIAEGRRAVFVVGAGHVVVGQQSLRQLLKSEPHGHNLIQLHP